MLRTLPLLIGLAILVAVGVVHGLWTDRWHPSEALVQASARLEGLPTTLGGWTSIEYEQDPEMLELTGATGCFSRTFTDPQTGERVLVILLVGKPARMAVHRPEHCYQSAGYTINGRPSKVELQPRGEPNAEFMTGMFSRDETDGPNQMRIFWSFFAADRWSMPNSPRLAFAREPVLYKLYVIRNTTGPTGPLENDACVRLLGLLLPVFNRTLPGSPS